MMSWFKINDQQVELRIFVKPNAKRTALIEINNEQGVVIALHAKPKEGEANRELIDFLAKWLGFPKSAASLKSGEHSRYKKVLVPLNEKVKTILTS